MRLATRAPVFLETALAMALTFAGCGGGGSPTTPAIQATPTPTPPPVLSFADGLSDAVLTAKSVTPANPKVGDMITVALDGYLTREQKWTGMRVDLWPVTKRGSQQAYEDLIYGSTDNHPLRRWAAMRYTAVAGSFPAAKDAEVRSHLDGVFAAVAGAGGPVFSWASAGSSSGNITVRLDPADECLQPDYAVCTRWWNDGSTITRAEFIFSEADYALDDHLTIHMMGTAIGLSHWNHDNAVMNPTYRGRPSGFHELERNAIHMMYQHRIAGNVLPDRDPGFTSAAGSRGVEVEQERRNR